MRIPFLRLRTVVVIVLAVVMIGLAVVVTGARRTTVRPRVGGLGNVIVQGVNCGQEQLSEQCQEARRDVRERSAPRPLSRQ